MPEEQTDKLTHSEYAKMKREVKSRVAGYLTAAFGLVAGLAWNDAIKAFIEQVFPIARNTLIAKFIYAVVITFILVVVTMYVVRMFSGVEKEHK